MYRILRIERLKAVNRIGRRGLLLVLGGLSWLGVGILLIAEPRDRFSSPGAGTDSILQVLDSPLFAYMWVIAGFIAMFTGLFRDRRLINAHDAVGFNALLTPPLSWTLFFAWSYAVNLATGGREGQSTGLYSFIVWALICLFIMVVAGWPETYTATIPQTENNETEE